MSEDPKVYERIGDLEVTTAVHGEKLSDHSKRLDKLEFKVMGWVGLIVIIIQGGYLILEKMGKP
jgi:hypothetical protein